MTHNFLANGAGQGATVVLTLAAAHPLVHLNAALNLLATLLLLAALWQVKRGREPAHGGLMLAAIATSAAFLVSYLIYHGIAGSVRFTHPGPIRFVYYAILISHVLLAFTVPFFVVAAAWLGATALGWRGQERAPATQSPSLPTISPYRVAARAKHIRLVRWAYPIWLYVSVTGVVVYAMLYHIWPSTDI